MKLQQLRYFLRAAEEGSLSRAARAEHVAQPALSQQIKNLEHSLGVVLFDRAPTGVTLTSSGVALLAHARHVLDSLERARLDVMSTANEVSGEVAIAIPRMLSATLSPIILRMLHDRYPKIVARIIEGTTLSSEEQVESARVDLGIGAKGQPRTGIKTRDLFQQQIYLVGAVDNRFAIAPSSVPIPFNEAVSFPLSMIRKPHSLSVELQALAQRRGVSLNTIIETESGAVNRHLVTGGVAFSFLPSLSFKEKEVNGQVFSRLVTEPGVRRGYVLQWPAVRKLNRASVVVADIIQETCADMFPTR